MITKISTAKTFYLTEEEIVEVQDKQPSIMKNVIVKAGLLIKWINPKTWFSSLANIELDLNEFACKKKPDF